jgi:energy-converting hydrogenase Eha subunit G
MNKKKVITGILAVLIGLAVAGSAITYFILQPDKPWLALFVAGMGGIIVVNLGLIVFFVNKNLKK